jgi:magnesium-transporting ATPase (P-type)
VSSNLVCFISSLLPFFHPLLISIHSQIVRSFCENLYDDWLIVFYNIIFTSLPVFVVGLFERDLHESIIERNPPIYRSQKKLHFLGLIEWIAFAFYHSFGMRRIPSLMSFCLLCSFVYIMVVFCFCFCFCFCSSSSSSSSSSCCRCCFCCRFVFSIFNFNLLSLVQCCLLRVR